jgi:hypothetical protein
MKFTPLFFFFGWGRGGVILVLLSPRKKELCNVISIKSRMIDKNDKLSHQRWCLLNILVDEFGLQSQLEMGR